MYERQMKNKRKEIKTMYTRLVHEEYSEKGNKTGETFITEAVLKHILVNLFACMFKLALC